MTLLVKKSLAGLEDFALGVGVESQIRGETPVSVTRVSAEWIAKDLAHIKSLDTSKIQHAIVFMPERRVYDFDPGSTLNGNDDDVVIPNVGAGRWVLRRENNQQSHQSPTEAADSTHEGIEPGFTIVVGGNTYYQYSGITNPDYAGQWPAPDGNYYDADGKQFTVYDPARLPTGLTVQPASSYTVVHDDASIAGGKTAILCTGNNDTFLYLPSHAQVPWNVGTPVNVIQGGEGQVTITGVDGVTVEGAFKSRGQFHAMSAVKIADNRWIAIGGIADSQLAPVTLKLVNHTLANENALCSVALLGNGELMTIDGAGGGVIMPNEWAMPRQVGLGNLYEARLSYVSGSQANQGNPTGVWLPIGNLIGWGVQESGATLNFVGTLEIRKIGTTQVLASCTINLTSTHV